MCLSLSVLENKDLFLFFTFQKEINILANYFYLTIGKLQVICHAHLFTTNVVTYGNLYGTILIIHSSILYHLTGIPA